MDIKEVIKVVSDNFNYKSESVVKELLIRNDLYDSNISVVDNIVKLHNLGIEVKRMDDVVSGRYAFMVSGNGIRDSINFSWYGV